MSNLPRLCFHRLVLFLPWLIPGASLSWSQTSGQFVAVGEAGVILTSPDGLAWTPRSSGTAVRLRGVTASGTQSVVVGEGGTVLTSADGIAWTARSVPIAETLRGIAFGGNRFVAVGGQTAGLILSSVDGVTWTKATVPALGKLRSVAWSGSQFLAVGAGGAACSSPDGQSWTVRSLGSSERLDLVVWHGGSFQVVSESGVVASSSDATAWTFSQLSAPTWIEGLTSGGPAAVAVGAGGRAFRTTNGAFWTAGESGIDLTLHGVTWTGSPTAPSFNPLDAVNSLRQSPWATLAVSSPSAAGEVVLTPTLTGAGPATLQWLLNGMPVAGATGASITVSAGALSGGVHYSVKVANAAGEAVSGSRILLPTGLQRSGALWGMGLNIHSQLGVGRPVFRADPVLAAVGVRAVRASSQVVLFLREDKSLWGMGINPRSGLGAGVSPYTSRAVNLAENALSFATGSYHTLYVLADGTLWSLGDNSRGQLGIGSLTDQSSPVQVATGVKEVWAGAYNSAFLKLDGTLWVMGDNAYGQLGDGSVANGTSPRLLASGVQSASVGAGHILFIKTDGSLWGVGRNLYGQLGLGTLTDVSSATSITTGVAAVSAGSNHTHFIRLDGSLWAAGLNANGQLGNGSTVQSPTPVQVDSGVTQVYGGNRHTLWRKADGSAWGTGWGGYGTLLGSGSKSSPLLLMSGVAGVAAGADSSLFLMLDGSLRTAGYNTSGNIGDNVPLVHARPVLVLPSGVSSITTARLHSVAVRDDASAWGFGWMVGGGALGDSSQAKLVPSSVATNVVAASTGLDFSLLLSASGEVRASGANDYGQLGDGTLTSRTSWTATLTNGASISSGPYSSAFVKRDGSVWMAGLNNYGQLGDGSTVDRATPVKVLDGVVAAAAGTWHSVFLRSDGSVWTVGRNVYGALGDGSTVNRPRPVLVATGVTAVATGTHHTLLVKRDGTLLGAGYGSSGQLGQGTVSSRSTLTAIASGVVQAAGGAEQSYFLKADGSMWACGGNQFGELGDGSFSQRLSPVKVAERVLGLASASSSTGQFFFIQSTGGSIAPPGFSVQPVATSVVVGEAISLAAAVSGEGPIDVQWYKNGVPIPGARGLYFRIPAAVSADAGVYHAVATNTGGTASSRSVLVSVAGSVGSQFAAVGETGVILTSPDGATWTSRLSPVTRRLRAVVATPGQFLAVGEAGNIVGSTDGVTWTARSSGVAHTLRGVAINPSGLLVAVGGEIGSVVLRSDDGVNWLSSPVVGTSRLRAVAWGNGMFLAVGTGGAAITSQDGVQWVARNTGAAERLDGVVWNGTAFQVLSERGLVYSSADGVVWTVSAARPPDWVEGFAWNGSRYVVVGAGGRVATSESGSTLNHAVSGTVATLHGVAWSGPVGAALNLTASLSNLIRQAPSVVVQPSSLTRFAGEAATFSFVASGASQLKFQWYRDGSIISGATEAALRLPGLTSAQAGMYHVVISNSFGSAASAGASLAVTDATLADGDGDGVSDRREVTDGTDPRDASSVRTSSRGLVAHYPFSGNANDTSGFAANGTVAGAVPTTDRRGLSNGAYRFDGVSARIEVPHASQQNQLPFTVSAWFRTPVSPGAPAGGGALVGKYQNASWNGWNLGISPGTGQIVPAYLRSRTSSVVGGYDGRLSFDSGTMTIADGRWRQIVFTVSSTEGILYLDGVEISRQGWTGPPSATISTYPLRIGTYSGGDTTELTFFRGDIDDVRIYNRVLSEEDVRRLNAEESASGDVPVNLAVWSAKSAPAHSARRVAWGGGRFVAVGGPSSITSTDGESWTAQQISGTSFKDIIWGNGVFVAGAATVGADNTLSVGSILTSPDGVTWTARHTTSPRIPSAVAFGAGRFVAFADDGDFGGQLLTSEDGIAWTARTSAEWHRVYGAQWTGTQFVAQSRPGVLVSPDGLNWTLRSIWVNGPIDVTAVAGQAARLVAAGVNSEFPSDRLWSSEDGIAWTLRPYGGAEPIRFLRQGGGNFIGVGAAGTLLTSGDGAGWTSRVAGTALELTGAAWSGSRWVVVGPGIILAAGAQLPGPLPAALAPQSIDFPASVAVEFGAPPFTLNASASSGLPVSFSVVSGPATVNGAIMTISGAGVVTVRASQPGNGFYAAASPVERSFIITKATPVLVWNSPLSLQAGTVLGSAQLNATANPTGGVFAYSPASGFALSAPGTQTLSVTYAPSGADSANFGAASLLRLLTVTPAGAPPVITNPPASQSIYAGATLKLTVAASGESPLLYSWRKDGAALADGSRISGVSSASLTIASTVAADAGKYSVQVSNLFGSAAAPEVTVVVLPAGLAATHSVPAGGYLPGASVVVENTISYPGVATGLGWQMLLPDGWSYMGGSGSEGEVKPVTGQTGALEWAWFASPASPVVFRATLAVPADQSGIGSISAIAITRLSGASDPYQVLAKPDPLLVSKLTTHLADSDRNFRISLLELTRVIELYNTRNGTTRTGCYGVATTTTEDGFASDATRASAATVTLTRYHSADSNRDGKISLLELTRVIELYNYRTGTTRTGDYHVHPGSEDGFNPGPASAHPTL